MAMSCKVSRWRIFDILLVDDGVFDAVVLNGEEDDSVLDTHDIASVRFGLLGWSVTGCRDF